MSDAEIDQDFTELDYFAMYEELKARSSLEFSVFIETLKYEIFEQGLQDVILITGRPGSGKSLTAIAIALAFMKEKFKLSYLTFKANEFVEILNRVRKGSAVIFDDAGIEFSARDWQRILNKILSFSLQVSRFKKCLIILTVPHKAFIDRSARLLCQYSIKTYGTYRDKDKTPTHIRAGLYIPHGEEEYDEVAVLRMGEQLRSCESILIPAPPKPLLEAYDAIAEANKTRILTQLKTALQEVEIRSRLQMYRDKKKLEKLMEEEEELDDMDEFR